MNNKSEPRVIVQLLSWNQLQEVVDCLESFSCITYQNYEVILVDNGSEDETVKTVREKYPFVTIIENAENLGFCKANNIGFRYCLKKNFDYLLLLNTDTKVRPNLLDELVRIMKNDPKIGIAGAKNLMLEDPEYMWGQYCNVTWGPMLVKIIGGSEPDRNLNQPPKEVDSVICNGCMISRVALETVGEFDENFWQCNEDIDWSYRAKTAGFLVVYVDTASILHKGGSSAALGRKKRFSYGYFIARNAFMFAKKYATPYQKVKLFCLVWFGVIVRLSLSISTSLVIFLRSLKLSVMGQRYFVRGIFDGLRGRLSPDYMIIQAGPPPRPPLTISQRLRIRETLPYYVRIWQRFKRWVGAL
ncbi:MAG: glycosyltransferase family 2 protein [Desulfobacteraceae bacterium]|nr:glycosyltransferase family 2 protein [Desulfobacteraceae bacterium]